MSQVNVENENRYLLFCIGGDLYGTPLLDVREVVEYQQPKYMPNMVKAFSGVINIRGSIVGVVDLRKKFGFPVEVNRNTTMLVCDSAQGAVAAVVDRVDSVVTIDESCVERKPPVLSAIDQAYLIGVGKVKDRLVTMVLLQKVLSEEKLVKEAV